MVKPSEGVLKRLPARCLQRLNNRQRFVFDGISYSPDTSEDENENENEQQIVEESDEQECEVKRNLDPLKEEDIENYYSDESPIDSYSVPHSLIDAFDPPGMTPVASDEEDEEEKISEPSSNKENVNQSTPESAATEIPNCNEDESREISKDSNNHEMKVDQSLTAETKYDSPIPTSSNAEKPAEQRKSIFQSQPLLLQRFKFPSRTKNQQISAQLPSAEIKTLPKNWQQRETPQQSHELTSRKTKGGKVFDQSLTAEAIADCPIPTSSNAETQAEKRNTICHSQQSRLALLFPRYLQSTTSAPSSQTTNLIPSVEIKTIPNSQQHQTSEQPNERIPLSTEKVLDTSFNAVKLPEIDASHFKESQKVNRDDTANLQERRNFGKKRSHPLTPQRQQFEFNDNSNDESPVASRVPPKRVPPNPAPSENVVDDMVLQTPSPPKETSSPQGNVPESPIDHDFGNDSFGENESSRRSNRIYDDSPVTIAHGFGDLSGNNEEIPTVPPRTTYTNVVAHASVNNESENVEADLNKSSHSIPAQNVLIPSDATISARIKKKNVVQHFQQKPELVKPNSPPSDQPFVQRSKRTRVPKLRLEYDENGLASLVDIKMNEQNYAHAGASQNGDGQKGKRNGRKTTKKK